MGISHIFNGKKRQIPGTYSTIKSGISNPVLATSYGNSLVIDTGNGAGFGGGSGINGEDVSGIDSVYTFDTLPTFRNFLGGGMYWFLAKPLFNPLSGFGGISSITYVRAATTTPASLVLSTENGALSLKSKDEGLIGNGVEADEVRAGSELQVTVNFVDTDVLTLSHDGTTIASYTFDGNPASIAASVGLIIDAINENSSTTGYAAKAAATSDSFIVLNKEGRGVLDNTESVTVVVGGAGTGTIVETTTFAGGTDGTILSKGYSLVLRAGIFDSAKYIIEFYRGSFKGYDEVLTGTSNTTYEGLSASESGSELVYSSSEFVNIEDFVTEAQEDISFTSLFKVSSYTDGALTATDLSTFSGNNLFSGGSESFSTSDLNDVLDALEGKFYDFVLLPDWGANGSSLTNTTIQVGLSSGKIVPDFYIGGGKTSSKFSSESIVNAQYFDSENVTVVHSGIKDTDPKSPSLTRDYESIYHTAYVMGREAGITPSNPLTNKKLGFKGLLHKVNEKERTQAINEGVICTFFDDNDASYYISKGVNTLQRNDVLVNSDGTTPSKQLRRIARQINKELIIGLTRDILRRPEGVNRATFTTTDLKQYVRSYLSSKEGDLLTLYRNIVVTVQGDAYFFEYEFEPTFAVNFFFGTGFMVDTQSAQ